MKKILLLIAVLLTALTVAACDKEEFTVTFDSNGGSEVSAITVGYDETFTAPADPTKKGHTFSGWYLNDKLYDFNFTVRENITLVAQWTINEYSLTINANGGFIGELNEEQKVLKVEYLANIPTIEEPTRDGYDFGG